MASSAPTFLTLPREVRDMIYGYLNHTDSLDEIPDQNDQSDKWAPTYVVFDNAPLPHVLRISSQIRDEYMESDRFVYLSAFTDATDGVAGYADAYLIPLEARKSPPQLTLWNGTNGYKSSSFIISTLWHLELLHGKVKNLATTRGYYIPELPNYFVDLPLLQRVDSFQRKPGEFIPVTGIGRYPRAYPYVIHSRANVGFHMRVVSAVFLYGSDSVHEKRSWDQQQIIDVWPIPGNHALAERFEYKSDEEAELTNNLGGFSDTFVVLLGKDPVAWGSSRVLPAATSLSSSFGSSMASETSDIAYLHRKLFDTLSLLHLFLPVKYPEHICIQPIRCPDLRGSSPQLSPNTNTSAIAGGVVGGLVVMAIVLGEVLLLLKRRKSMEKETPVVTNPDKKVPKREANNGEFMPQVDDHRPADGDLPEWVRRPS